jgi:hypothetical protein
LALRVARDRYLALDVWKSCAITWQS